MAQEANADGREASHIAMIVATATVQLRAMT
jgi:hypothetical protein